MRLSAEKTDPGYINFDPALSGAYRIFLDGVEQKFVLTADEELGYIARYMPMPARLAPELAAYRGFAIYQEEGEVRIGLDTADFE